MSDDTSIFSRFLERFSRDPAERPAVRATPPLRPLPLALCLLLLGACKQDVAADAAAGHRAVAEARVEALLESRGVEWRRGQDGAHVFLVDGAEQRVFLENTVRRMTYRPDPEAELDRFLASLTELLDGAPWSSLAWSEARGHLVTMLVSADRVGRLGDELFRPLGPNTALAVALDLPDSPSLAYVVAGLVEGWGVDDDAVWAAAEAGLDKALAEAPLKVRDAADGERVAVFSAQDLPRAYLAASLIRAKGLRARFGVAPGAPLYAVAPEREFAVVATSAALLRAQAEGLRRLQQEASHPVPLELFEITESGVRVIGSIPARD